MIDDSAVRQHVAEDDARVAGPEPGAGQHEFPPAERDELAAHQPRDAGPGHGGDGEDLGPTEGDRMATIRMARMKAGMVWKNSVTRISTTSTGRGNSRRPRRRCTPNTMAASVAPTPISSEVRAP